MSRFYRIIYAIFVHPVRALFRIRVTNPERMPPSGGCIICANHTSMLDVMILSAGLHRQIRYMAKKELFSVPIVRHLVTALGAYPVDRGGADVASIKRTIAFLENGELVGIFPQGTRRPGVNPAETPVKSGVGMIEWHSRATVVPAYIRTKGNRVRMFQKTELILGEPIPFDAFGFEGGGSAQYKRATERVFHDICALGGYERPVLPSPGEKAE